MSQAIHSKIMRFQLAIKSFNYDVSVAELQYFSLDDQRWFLNRLYAISGSSTPIDLERFFKCTPAKERQMVINLCIEQVVQCNKIWQKLHAKLEKLCEQSLYRYSFAKMTISLMRLMNDSEKDLKAVSARLGYDYDELMSYPESPDGEPLILDDENNLDNSMDYIKNCKEIIERYNKPK